MTHHYRRHCSRVSIQRREILFFVFCFLIPQLSADGRPTSNLKPHKTQTPTNGKKLSMELLPSRTSAPTGGLYWEMRTTSSSLRETGYLTNTTTATPSHSDRRVVRKAHSHSLLLPLGSWRKEGVNFRGISTSHVRQNAIYCRTYVDHLA